MRKINRLKFEFKHWGRRRDTAPKHKGEPSLAMKLTHESDARDSIYTDWRLFGIDEINSFIGLLVPNSICPKVNARLWFVNDSESKIFSNNNFK